jgi:gluconokinase
MNVFFVVYRYRDFLSNGRSPIHFVYLKCPKEVLTERLLRRKPHFMKIEMLESQLSTLEEPTLEEKNVLLGVFDF